MRDSEAVSVRWVEPDIVVIASRNLFLRKVDHRRPAIERFREVGREEVRLVRIVGLDTHAIVVGRAPGRLQVATDEAPVFPGVIRAKETSRVRRLPLARHAVTRLDLRVNAFGHRSADAESDLAEWAQRKTVPDDPRPCGAAVCRLPDSASRAAARASPRVNLDLPGSSVCDSRIRRIEEDIDAAGGVVDEENALPCLAAIDRLKDASLLLRTIRMSECRDERAVGVRWIDRNARDASGLLQANVRPALAGIRRPVHAKADGDVASNERLAGADPDDVRIRGRDSNRADGRHGLIVEDRGPVGAGVDGLPESAARRACVVDVGVTLHAGHRVRAIPFGPDVAIVERGQCARIGTVENGSCAGGRWTLPGLGERG